MRLEIDESFFDDYIDNFRKFYDELPKQLIHRDPQMPANILFEDGEVSGFIDFDLSEVEILRLWDVSTVQPEFCLKGATRLMKNGSRYLAKYCMVMTLRVN